MPFRQIIGHTAVRASLEQDLVTENVSHAYLFSGPRHLGKMMMARAFARVLLTQHLAPEAAAASVHAIERLTHPDLLTLDQLWIEDVCEDPAVIGRSTNLSFEHRRKAGAKTDSISIDDVRTLQERLYETATGPYRCCIIRSVERMDSAPANAFLKVLEEPPEGMVFLLTTQALQDLLPTVTSRCRIIHCTRVADGDILPSLSHLSKEDARLVLLLAQGCPGMALTLATDPERLLRERTLQAQAQAFWAVPSSDQMLFLKPLLQRGESADQLLFHLYVSLKSLPPSSHPIPRIVSLLTELSRHLATNASRQLGVAGFVLELHRTKILSE